MRQTKKVTLSAMIVALGTVFMVLGGFIEVLDLSVCALASLLVVFAYIEIGKPYYWLVWICTSLATFLLSPGKQLWILYLAIFGIYPILKAFFERIKNRSVWLVLKLVYINIILVAFTLVWEFVFSVPLFVFDNKLFVAIAYAVVNVGFIAYDAFISVMVRLYFVKLRPRFKGLLK